MFKRAVLSSYDDVFEELKKEITTKDAYKKKLVDLEIAMSSESNLMSTNNLGISTLLAFLVTFMFNNAFIFVKSLMKEVPEVLKHEEYVPYIALIVFIAMALFLFNNDNHKRNFRHLELKQQLLILKQESAFLNQDRIINDTETMQFIVYVKEIK